MPGRPIRSSALLSVKGRGYGRRRSDFPPFQTPKLWDAPNAAHNGSEESNPEERDGHSSWGWESQQNLPILHPEVQKYLGRDGVVAVKLPEMVSGDQTYSTVSRFDMEVDGASGVGKTQQAFALLNDGKKQELAYFLWMDPQSNSGIRHQEIYYQDMISMTGTTDFLKMVDSAIKAVSANTAEQGKEIRQVQRICLFAYRNSKQDCSTAGCPADP